MEEVERYYQGSITLEEAESYIASGMMTAARAFVANGYYLRRIRDEKLYKESGYKNFKEYLGDRYRKDEGWASKCIKVNQQLSVGGNSPILDSKYCDYNDKYKLVELASMTEEQRTQVSPDMSVKALREFRKGEDKNLVTSQENQAEANEPEVTDAVQEVATVETLDPEPKKLSAYGTAIKAYTEDNPLATPGCEGGHDCFMCHLQCDIRQEYCRCVEATTGNPFPCEQIDRIDVLQEEAGERCQFVNLDLAYHRAGDHEPVPCCKDCKEPCQYACERSVQKREAVAPEPEPEELYFTLENERTIDGAYGASLSEVVRTYLDELDSRGFNPMSDNIPDIEVRAMGLEYLVTAGDEFAVFKRDGGMPIKVERKRLQGDYDYWYPDPEPQTCNMDPSACPHRDSYSCTLTPNQKNTPGDGNHCDRSCCWECKYHGMCEQECDSSAGRDGKRPEFNAAWFVQQWVKHNPNSHKAVMRICRERISNSDRAKAVQKYIAPCGYSSLYDRTYHQDFHGFAGGMDFAIGRVKIHLKYGRFVAELLELYDPSLPEYDEEPVKQVQEEKEQDPVIDAEFEEISEPSEELKIEELYLSNRTEIMLKRAGIDTVEGLASMSDDDLTAVRGMSKRAMEEIRVKLEGFRSVDETEPKTEDSVIDTEFEEFQEPEPAKESLSDLQIAREELDRADRLFRTCLLDMPDQNDIHLRRMKVKVDALASYVRGLDTAREPAPSPEQPGLPQLKNNDQRAAFVDAYETWPLWIETAETGERYYRYDFPDGTSMVVKAYHAMLFDYEIRGVAYEERFSEGYGKEEYYLLREGKFFKDCEANRSTLIEHLKEIQKKGRTRN